MIIISHRGNLEGPTNSENHPSYIKNALELELNCEVDVWYTNGKYWLGHDEPMHEIEESFLENDKLWCHAKNKEALENMIKNNKIHSFWHQEDDYTITSRGYAWVFPDKPLLKNSICVKPELGINGDLNKCHGVCTDYVLKYQR